MTDLLIKIFIKDNNDVSSPDTRSAYATLASLTGIAMNIILFAGKLFVGILSGSVAIIADAFNNISDAGASVVTLIGFRLSNKPVDSDHPLGHGRMEYISGFIVDMLIILVGFELFTSSVDKIIHPSQTNVSMVTFVLLVIAIFVKLWLYLFYGKIARTISSAALMASSKDSISDCIATVLVVFSSVCTYFGLFSTIPIDGIVGIIVAVFILYTGINAAKETIDLLLGTPPDKEFIREIASFIKEFPEIVGIHDLMVHDYGPGRKIISFHAEVPSDSDINHAHEVIDRVEILMGEKFGCIATIHLDPIVVNDEEVTKMYKFTKAAAKAVDENFNIHDFRMTKGDTHINVIFDLVVPTDSKYSIDEAVKAVSAKITEEIPDCSAVIRGEHPYV
ncbi:MAG: cation transporter [Eubacteriaceae bacterium]|nr:cation transporter [Eubacteriaceae bacterium]